MGYSVLDFLEYGVPERKRRKIWRKKGTDAQSKRKIEGKSCYGED